MGGGATFYLDRIIDVESACYANIFESERHMGKKKPVMEKVLKVVVCETLFRGSPGGYDGGNRVVYWDGVSAKVSTLRQMDIADDIIWDRIVSSRKRSLRKGLKDDYYNVYKKMQCLEVYRGVLKGLDALLEKKILRH